ncbi:MAG: 50S ribosome-binding GTPase, partial [Nitrospiraceae bacterium]|nr:50S ribosome-binding GTPase [Nitrospiraceae bacterium]
MGCHGECKEDGKGAALKKIALIGNPNVGKSVIFGLLTGKYVTVSNYPGTTVEVSSGNINLGGTRLLLVDTPGVNSLLPMSEDERVTRDILLSDRPSLVVQVGDSKNLKRTL